MTGTVTAGRYRLEPPTTDDFRTAVGRAGADEATWERLCSAAGIPAEGPHTLYQLDLLADAVKAEPGALGVVGRSLSVRLMTFHTLAFLDGAPR